MPSLANHQSNDLVKLLLLGTAKSGKTGSLVSLVKAGYKLRILDMDNLLDFLKGQVYKHCPDKINNVEFRTIRDEYKATGAGTVVDGKPKAWLESLRMLNHWRYTEGEQSIDLGDPAGWGTDTILVIDSLSRWCDAAYAFHETMTPKGRSGEADGRAVYGNAQRDIEKQLAMLTSNSFKTNVIVICHGMFLEQDDGKTKIFPRSLGKALSPNIPSYFPNYIRYTHNNNKRSIQLVSDNSIDLSTTRPDILDSKELSVETGLAELFAALKQPAANRVERPKAVTLKRI